MGQGAANTFSLNLVFGRRFGLVGSNGVGKSTLLRAIARRELNIPNYITILHVEQEVTGDDTPALQAVLEADVWRTYLMNESEVGRHNDPSSFCSLAYSRPSCRN